MCVRLEKKNSFFKGGCGCVKENWGGVRERGSNIPLLKEIVGGLKEADFFVQGVCWVLFSETPKFLSFFRAFLSFAYHLCFFIEYIPLSPFTLEKARFSFKKVSRNQKKKKIFALGTAFFLGLSL